jgi:hypothetical protein
VNGAYTSETKSRKRAANGFSLRIENSGLRADKDAHFQSTAPLCVISCTLRSISA